MGARIFLSFGSIFVDFEVLMSGGMRAKCLAPISSKIEDENCDFGALSMRSFSVTCQKPFSRSLGDVLCNHFRHRR